MEQSEASEKSINVTKLPVYKARSKIIEAFDASNVMIVVGETGSGKTTQIPQFLYHHIRQIKREKEQKNKKILIGISQPRRVAAITVAKRVASEMQTKIGGKVGYQVRFDDCTSEESEIVYLTDGMLLREAAMGDACFSRYDVIILDEAHERSLRTDILFGLTKQVLVNGTNATNEKSQNSSSKKIFRKDPLHVVVMSATLDIDFFQSFFTVPDNAIVKVPGRQFPVSVYYAPKEEDDRIDAAVVAVMQIHLGFPFGKANGKVDNDDDSQHKSGDILVFLTGQDEIEACAEILEEKARKLPKDKLKLIVCPLYSALSSEQQSAAFEKTPPLSRKVILSTNIAETSVTVSGVKYVVDCGAVKTRQFHPRTGFESLDVQQISKAQAWQRTGRAGREGPGISFRLYTEEVFEKDFREKTVAEINRVDLSEVVLQLYSIGVKDILNFPFLEAPRKESILAAQRRLIELGAIDKRDLNTLTKPIGTGMAALPLNPTHSNLLLRAIYPELGSEGKGKDNEDEEKNANVSGEILTIVSMMSAEPPFVQPRRGNNGEEQMAIIARRKYVSIEGDHITLLNIFQQFQEHEQQSPETLSQWCYENFLKMRTLVKAKKIRKQLEDILVRVLPPERVKLLKDKRPPAERGATNAAILKCLLKSFGATQIAWRKSTITMKEESSSQAMKLPNNQGSGKYVTNISNVEVSIHPSSSLFANITGRGSKQFPECVLYDELVVTSKKYIRGVSAIQKSWLLQASGQALDGTSMKIVHHGDINQPAANLIKMYKEKLEAGYKKEEAVTNFLNGNKRPRTPEPEEKPKKKSFMIERKGA